MREIARRASGMAREAGYHNHNPVPGIGSGTPRRWQYSKAGPNLRALLIALGACGYTLEIVRKDKTE